MRAAKPKLTCNVPALSLSLRPPPPFSLLPLGVAVAYVDLLEKTVQFLDAVDVAKRGKDGRSGENVF